jgi:hypothetical protein
MKLIKFLIILVAFSGCDLKERSDRNDVIEKQIINEVMYSDEKLRSCYYEMLAIQGETAFFNMRVRMMEKAIIICKNKQSRG